ncbi:hypothetical protein [Micromonospora sp. DT41]|uniref:hypothetical protein n=1 Tax=Micromonospora sp. DT41 TaxID=3393437 RepID=UPI003CF3B847
MRFFVLAMATARLSLGSGVVRRPALGHHVAVDLIRCEALSQVLQNLELALGQQLAERFQLNLVGDRTDGTQHLVVDAQVAQHCVGLTDEQQRRRLRRGLLQRWGELFDGDDVTDLQRPGRRVGASCVIGRRADATLPATLSGSRPT